MPIPPFLEPEQISADQTAVIQYARSLQPKREVNTYLEALQVAQPSHPPDSSGEPNLVFNISDRRAVGIFQDFETEEPQSSGTHFMELSSSEIIRAQKGFQAGMSIISSYDARLPSLIQGLVGTWIFARRAGMEGGSFWFALGTVWLGPSDSWSDLTYAENILHESTHQATFLSDMVRGVFKGDSAMRTAPESLVLSPIRQVPRRYDFAFHAAAVAAVLSDFHHTVGDSRKTRELYNGLIQSLPELRAHDSMLEPAGMVILTNLETYVTARSEHTEA